MASDLAALQLHEFSLVGLLSAIEAGPERLRLLAWDEVDRRFAAKDAQITKLAEALREIEVPRAPGPQIVHDATEWWKRLAMKRAEIARAALASLASLASLSPVEGER